MALVYAILGVLLRSIIKLPDDSSFLIQILLLAVMVMFVFCLGPVKSIMATVFGLIVMALGEVIFSIIIINLFGPTIIKSTNPLILLIVPLPQIIMTLIIIYLCIRFEFHLFDLKPIEQEPIATFESKRIKTITILVLVLLVVIFVQIAFSASVINKAFAVSKALPLPMMGIISTFILVIGVLAMGLLIRQLVELTQKESQYHAQAIYINTLDELYTAVRSERHDIINHLQTIYGFNQLGYTEEVQKYLSELLGGNILSNKFIVTGTPGLTALFYIKSGIARTNDIEFKVAVDQQIDNLKVSPYELNNIIGNLINNAFDAVMPLENEQKIVNVYIGADDDNYVIKVSNYGYISDQTKQNIMKKGFSTKKAKEHSGLGLHICNTLAQKYGGSIKIENIDDHMVEISALFPANAIKGDLNEFASQKTGSFTG
ncbi:MAG: GHKL domain-containing protein [Syntrophomonas sp.]|nr:GHKL domain-containing protein [Syntrophomonas sp.]